VAISNRRLNPGDQTAPTASNNVVNTLEFDAPNTGGPMGLQAQLTGTASAVPEPAPLTLATLGGLAAFRLIRRRRRPLDPAMPDPGPHDDPPLPFSVWTVAASPDKCCSALMAA